jgi:hypothetical protein
VPTTLFPIRQGVVDANFQDIQGKRSQSRSRIELHSAYFVEPRSFLLFHRNINYNHFSGQIPAPGPLNKLEQLYLQANQFSGSIPSDVGRLPSLLQM